MDYEQQQIECMEYAYLQKIMKISKDIVQDLNNNLNNSKLYMEYIVLPLLIASIEEKTYNPFSNMIEKYVEMLFINKAKDEGWAFLPIGYSSDLCFESNEAVIHIDIKTANIDNPSDFKETVPLGFNQFSYHGALPLGNRGNAFYVEDGIDKLKIYPNIPVEYKIEDSIKVSLTYAIQFIYPSYKAQIDNIRPKYIEIFQLIDSKLEDFMYKELQKCGKAPSKNEIKEFLDHKPEKSREKRSEIITENLLRVIFLHNINLELYFSVEEQQKITNFKNELSNLVNELNKLNISPIGLMIISIPNGKLAPIYDGKIVSGKNYGRSIRYHYESGVFKSLKDMKRVHIEILNDDYRFKLMELLPGVFPMIRRSLI